MLKMKSRSTKFLRDNSCARKENFICYRPKAETKQPGWNVEQSRPMKGSGQRLTEFFLPDRMRRNNIDRTLQRIRSKDMIDCQD